MVTTLLMPASRSKVGSDCELWPLLKRERKGGERRPGLAAMVNRWRNEKRKREGGWRRRFVLVGLPAGERNRKRKGKERRREEEKRRKKERGMIFVFASFLFFLSFDFFPYTLVVPTKEEREFGSGFFIF